MRKQYIILAILLSLAPSTASATECRKYSRTNSKQTSDEIVTDIACPADTFVAAFACNIVEGYGMTEGSIISSRSVRCSTFLEDMSDTSFDDNGDLIEAAPVYGKARVQVLCCK